jgi:hypothetical protein
MTTHPLWKVAGVAAVLVLAAVVPTVAQQTQPAPKCCFSNSRYTGVCEVTPGQDETCASILAYLNNLASTGKSYCGNTTVRGDWASVECKTAD